MYNVYVLKNQLSSKIYVGQTRDIDQRLKRHNGTLKSKGSSYTYLNKGKWDMVYHETYNTRSEALVREKQLKSFRGREFIKSQITGPLAQRLEQ